MTGEFPDAIVSAYEAFDIHKLFGAGNKVTRTTQDHLWTPSKNLDATESGLLIGIRRIKQDTAEDLLRAIIKWIEKPCFDNNNLIDRAKTLLEGK